MLNKLRTDAIILRRTNYGEADRILNIITPNDGKISVMARSVRKEKSRLAGGIELFAICDVVLHIGSGEIATLVGSKMKEFFDQIITEYDRMQFGYEAIKQISKASETINDPEFYNLLKDCLSSLNNLKINLKVIQAWFYLQLAKLLGNELNTATDNNGMKLVEDAIYSFDINQQVFTFNENGEYDADRIKLLRVINNNKPDVISRVAGIESIIDECLKLAQIAAKL